MNKRFRKFFPQMIHYRSMRYIFAFIISLPLLSVNLNAEYEMHIPNCTQKGVENCGGFLFDNETGDVLFCGSESCIDLKLPKSWKAKQKDKQSKQDQIIEMLSNIQVGSVNTNVPDQSVVTTFEKSEDTNTDQTILIDEEKEKEEKKVEIEIEECDLEKKSLCKGSGGMQIGGGLDDDIMGDF